MKGIIKKINEDTYLLEINSSIYDAKAALNAAYKFTDKCYIHNKPVSNNVMEVYFQPKHGNEQYIENIASEFCNELIDQQVRIDTEKAYHDIRDAIVKQAFSPIEPTDRK